MTDITPIQPSGAPGRPEGAHGPGPAGKTPGDSFAKLLEEAARADRTGAAGALSPGQGVPVSPTPYIGPIQPGPAIQAAVLDLSHRFLALAEKFQTQLADPKASLRDIAPLVKDLEAHRDELTGRIAALPAGDPGRGLLEEMASLVSTESVKFHRGDYV
ncbi:MAG: hypothetical protein A3J27_02685 [Candidatus Tectomicrobia bacterium RIFCSPLOWO2_12_FULL_69_37]|nr:MAG: hypothetical protein A3J27_02685 [Candidatus Tectomicrobia bacterium RIFCSPLOWO2_12_FULL_69_37]